MKMSQNHKNIKDQICKLTKKIEQHWKMINIFPFDKTNMCINFGLS